MNDFDMIPVGEELPTSPKKRWALVAPVIPRFQAVWQEGAEELVTDRVLNIDGFELHFIGTTEQIRQWLRNAADSLTD